MSKMTLEERAHRAAVFGKIHDPDVERRCLSALRAAVEQEREECAQTVRELADGFDAAGELAAFRNLLLSAAAAIRARK